MRSDRRKHPLRTTGGAFKRGTVFALMLAIPFFGMGCEVVPEEGTRTPASTRQSPTPMPPPPSDPDAPVTITILKGDGSNGWKVASHQTMTKGEQYRLWSARAGGESKTEGKDGIEEVQRAIIAETCQHGSAIVVYDQTNFGGNALCFADDGQSRNSIDLSALGFVARSAYATVNTYLENASGSIQFAWCGSSLHYASDLTGYSIRYVQTPGTRWGPCHF